MKNHSLNNVDVVLNIGDDDINDVDNELSVEFVIQ